MKPIRIAACGVAVLLMAVGVAAAEDAATAKAVNAQDGEYFDASGSPTYHVAQDGTADWYSYEGYLRYGANCQQCHGPDGLGSSYAPSLVHSLQTLGYADFDAAVAGGKTDVNAAQELVMPAFGTNPNVMCYIDAIYVYLRARSDGALGRERPEAHEPKPEAFAKAEDACMD